MNNLKLFKALFIIGLLAGISACTELNKKESVSEEDLFEIQHSADAAYQKDDLVEAEKHYTALVKAVPSEPINWFRLGNIYARTKRPDAAITAYREVLVRDPQFANAWYNMGIVQLKEAAHSFTQLQIYTGEDQPLYGQSRRVVDGILNILKNDNGNGE